MPTPSGIPTPTPSGTGVPWGYISHVTDTQFEEASAALDRALLRVIGLPESVEIREFENAVYAMTTKINTLAGNFTLSQLIVLLPELITDGLALWEKVEPHVAGAVNRKEFVSKVITYVYRKYDPDISFLVEPFESMVENMILGAIPGLMDNIEGQLEKLLERIRGLFG
jgi:hypothetical protein